MDYGLKILKGEKDGAHFAPSRERIRAILSAEQHQGIMINTEAILVGQYMLIKAVVTINSRALQGSGHCEVDLSDTHGFRVAETIAISRALASIGVYDFDNETFNKKELTI